MHEWKITMIGNKVWDCSKPSSKMSFLDQELVFVDTLLQPLPSTNLSQLRLLANFLVQPSSLILAKEISISKTSSKVGFSCVRTISTHEEVAHFG